MKKQAVIIASVLLCITAPAFAQRQRENLDRGVVAVRDAEGKVFVSWRQNPGNFLLICIAR
jgi:hypothetical protein